MHIVIVCAGRLRAEMLSGRLQDAERQRDDVAQRLDSQKRAAARAEKDWELERNNLHVCSLRGSVRLQAVKSSQRQDHRLLMHV